MRADPTGRLQVVHDMAVDGGDLWDLAGLRGVAVGSRPGPGQRRRRFARVAEPDRRLGRERGQRLLGTRLGPQARCGGTRDARGVRRPAGRCSIDRTELRRRDPRPRRLQRPGRARGGAVRGQSGLRQSRRVAGAVGARALLPAVARGDARGRAGRVPASPAGLARRGCGGRRRLPGVPVRRRGLRGPGAWTRCVPSGPPAALPGRRRLLRGRRRGRRSGLRRGRRRGPADRADVRSGGAAQALPGHDALVRGGATQRAQRWRRRCATTSARLRRRSPRPGEPSCVVWRRTRVVARAPDAGGDQRLPPASRRHPDVRARAGTPAPARLRRGLRLALEGRRGVRRLPAVSRSSGTAAACCCRAPPWPGEPPHSCARTSATACCSGRQRPWGCSPTPCARPGPAASSGSRTAMRRAGPVCRAPRGRAPGGRPCGRPDLPGGLHPAAHRGGAGAGGPGQARPTDARCGRGDLPARCGRQPDPASAWARATARWWCACRG